MANRGKQSADKILLDYTNNDQKEMEALKIATKLNSIFFIKSKGAEVRSGLHASAIIVSDSKFCLREQVLSLFFVRTEHGTVSPGLQRIFTEGESIHEKWQRLFVNAGIATGIEKRVYSSTFDLYMTPDASIRVGKNYIVEIKSCNTFAYKKLKDKHIKGTDQCNLYMYFTSTPDGFVLAEDKNTQDFKLLMTEYDPSDVVQYIERLYKIKEAKDNFLKSGKLPQRKCKSSTCKEFLGCALNGACSGSNRKYLEEWASA